MLVTAGPTQEAIDPVRYITNHSTGKMGYAIAENAMLRGADVTLVTGPCAVEPPMFVKVKPVISAQDMYEAVTEEYERYGYCDHDGSSGGLPPGTGQHGKSQETG